MKSNAGFKVPSRGDRWAVEVVLLNQFHDILPGSSITLVYEDSAKQYAHVLSEAAKLRDSALAALAQGGGVATPVNTTAFARKEIVANPGGALVYVEAPAYGPGRTTAPSDSVRVTDAGERIVMENAQLRAEITKGGQVVALVHKASGRQVLDGPADLMLYDDDPTNWEAWDVDPSHLETGKPVAAATAAVQRDVSPLRGQLTFTRKVGRSSSITQTIRWTLTRDDWSSTATSTGRRAARCSRPSFRPTSDLPTRPTRCSSALRSARRTSTRPTTSRATRCPATASRTCRSGTSASRCSPRASTATPRAAAR
jgi:alpha-mannosidase